MIVRRKIELSNLTFIAVDDAAEGAGKIHSSSVEPSSALTIRGDLFYWLTLAIVGLHVSQCLW